jgi:Uma2 family endonuclease
MVTKLNTFMLSGCKEYWIVDVKKKRVSQYSFLDCSIEKYEFITIEESLESVAFEGLSFEVKGIFV